MKDETVHPRWRHKKRGTTYVEVGRATVQDSGGFGGVLDGVGAVVYRGEEDGKLWVRAPHEFEDGRFENVGFIVGDRDLRQQQVSAWVLAAFGEANANELPQRGVRMLEEAVELYQATGATPEMAHRLIDFVFSRPVGELSQEIGGVGVCILALANAAGFSADRCEQYEYDRVKAKPLSLFAARNEAKNAAGFDAKVGKDAPPKT